MIVWSCARKIINALMRKGDFVRVKDVLIEEIICMCPILINLLRSPIAKSQRFWTKASFFLLKILICFLSIFSSSLNEVLHVCFWELNSN